MNCVGIDCIGDARTSHINNESIMFDAGDCFAGKQPLLLMLLLLLHFNLWEHFSPIGLVDRWLTLMAVENFFECGDGGSRI